jgi:hypothetical protein
MYARSSQVVPSGKVHIPICPHVESSIVSIPQLFLQLVDAGFANPTVHVFSIAPVVSVHVAY